MKKVRSINKNASHALSTLQKLLNVVASELSSDVPVHVVGVLIAVAMAPELSLTDIQMRVGLSKSQATRVVQSLCEWRSEGEAGYGLLMVTEDPSERRRKRVTLTTRGERSVARLIQALQL